MLSWNCRHFHKIRANKNVDHIFIFTKLALLQKICLALVKTARDAHQTIGKCVFSNHGTTTTTTIIIMLSTIYPNNLGIFAVLSCKD